MFRTATIDELDAFHIGHAQDQEALTGCTVILAPSGASCGVDVRGGGPATRETDLLKPENMIQQVHAVVLSGGSAFGLEASSGVMDVLAKQDIGFHLGDLCVPIVCGACLFDLSIGKNIYPTKAMGEAAALQALSNDAAAAASQGNVGAGTGATVGKLGSPMQAMKSGLGLSVLALGDLIVGAVVAVNALGCVRDRSGRWIAGVRGDHNQVMDPLQALGALMAAAASENPQESFQEQTESGPCTNTTLGVVLTNGKLTKAEATKVASTTHDAYARAIKPVHSSNDGDTIFCLSSNEIDTDPDIVAFLSTEAMEQAIVSAVLHAQGAGGLPAACDL